MRISLLRTRHLLAMMSSSLQLYAEERDVVTCSKKEQKVVSSSLRVQADVGPSHTLFFSGSDSTTTTTEDHTGMSFPQSGSRGSLCYTKHLLDGSTTRIWLPSVSLAVTCGLGAACPGIGCSALWSEVSRPSGCALGTFIMDALASG